MKSLDTSVETPSDGGATPESFEEFARDQQVGLLAVAFGLTRNVEDARDLAQESLTRAFERWDEVAVHPNPAGWVRRVLVNLHGDGRRRVTAGRKVLRLVQARHVSRTRATADAALGTIGFWNAVAELTPRQQEVTVLRSVTEASHAEIAEVLDLTEATVRSHLATARTRLAELLDIDGTRTEKGDLP